jgi:hypothetical protein
MKTASFHCKNIAEASSGQMTWQLPISFNKNIQQNSHAKELPLLKTEKMIQEQDIKKGRNDQKVA